MNLTTPHPVSNAEFTAALAAALHRPALLFLPAPALKLAVGGVSSDILSSARVLPRRLLARATSSSSPDLRRRAEPPNWHAAQPPPGRGAHDS